MPKKICVFASASNYLDEIFINEAKQVGKLIAENDFELVYGGGKIGLMYYVASETKQHNGKITGIVPKKIYDWDVCYKKCDEFIITKNMRERKALMDEKSDAVIALAGGLGTLDEVIEMITLKQLQYHFKPIVIINTNNFYNDLINMFKHICENKFADKNTPNLYYIAKDANDAIEYIKNYSIEEAKNVTSKLKSMEEEFSK